MALIAPAFDTGGDGLFHDAETCGFTCGELFGQLGFGGDRGDFGLGKAELATGFDIDHSAVDLARRGDRRDGRGVYTVDGNLDDRSKIPFVIEHGQKAGIIGLRGSQKLLRGGVCIFVCLFAQKRSAEHRLV